MPSSVSLTNHSLGHPYMAKGKNHSIKHTPVDVVLYGDAINVSCEAPDIAHKNWVKGLQGDCINQGPNFQMTMMLHSLRKDSAMLCEGVQGKCTC